MALIACPECNKQISSMASACPDCGCPIGNFESSMEIARPNLSADLSIGRQVINWTNDAAVSGDFDSQLNTYKLIPEGNGHLLLHQEGIKVSGKYYSPIMDIHFSQVINVKCVPPSQIFETDKSVIKRAAVGTILLGPLGGIIGGMSGIGRKKIKYECSVIINYWDVESDSLQTISLSTNKTAVAKNFCDNVTKHISH